MSKEHSTKEPSASTTDSIDIDVPIYRAEFFFKTEANNSSRADFIRAGQPLIELKPADKVDAPLPCKLIKGENTILDNDERLLLSDIDGFPFLTQTVKQGVDYLAVSMVPLCVLAKDKMSAEISLYPALTPGNELDVSTLIEILKDNNIKFGFNENHLCQLLDRCSSQSACITREPFAHGLLPINGKDSFLRFAIEVGPLPGKLLGNGKIDFRERKMFVGVAEGETIATRVAATNGTPGLNVSREQVPQTPGRNLPVSVSDDANYDEETGLITATHSGILSMVNENSVKVCSKQIISSNIDYSTGNIESQDAVEITGSILPGFKVKTNGDLLLGGNVREASVSCQGNLVIKGGILGKDANVKVGGDADFSFMEQGNLRTGGRVVIRKQSYYARIMADGDICCEERSQIMSGELMAGNCIITGTVGSVNSPSALLAAAISPGRYLRYRQLQNKLREESEALLQIIQRFGQRKVTERREELEDSIAALTNEIKKLNLLPTGLTSDDDEAMRFLRTISITVNGAIHAGTIIRIGNSHKSILTTRQRVRFSLDRYSSLLIEEAL